MKGIAHDVENLMQSFWVHIITKRRYREILTLPISGIHKKFGPLKMWRTFMILMDPTDIRCKYKITGERVTIKKEETYTVYLFF